MAKKPTTEALPGMTGPGVAPLSIPELDKAVNRYETKKEKRCEASPGEVAAKRDLRELLAKHKDKLPANEDGLKYYRHDGVDYILEEVLKRRNADEGGDPEGTD